MNKHPSCLAIAVALGLASSAVRGQSFTEQTGIALTGVYYSSVAWGDYDNDSDLDILLTGYDLTTETGLSKIYRNDGNDTFVEQAGIALTPVWNSAVAWGDYDNDGNLDIVLTGESTSGPVSKIYRNQGGAVFTEQTDIELIGVGHSSVAWGDCDNCDRRRENAVIWPV